MCFYLQGVAASGADLAQRAALARRLLAPETGGPDGMLHVLAAPDQCPAEAQTGADCGTCKERHSMMHTVEEARGHVKG